jgi:hypothetical protein
MTTVIAILALCTSVFLLIVQYRNQVERRHGEIAKLHSEFLQRMANSNQRMISLQIHMETIRLELRRMPESQGKYIAIENMPLIIEGVKRSVKIGEEVYGLLEQFDTERANKSKVLIKFQSKEHLLQEMEDVISTNEQKALDIFSVIRSNQEKENIQSEERLDKSQ